MNRNDNIVIDFQINHKHDHYIGKDKRHVCPQIHNKAKATKGYRRKRG
jgi:hypothetical protein